MLNGEAASPSQQVGGCELTSCCSDQLLQAQHACEHLLGRGDAAGICSFVCTRHEHVSQPMCRKPAAELVHADGQRGAIVLFAQHICKCTLPSGVHQPLSCTLIRMLTPRDETVDSNLLVMYDMQCGCWQASYCWRAVRS
jgi:hypothetical protein